MFTPLSLLEIFQDVRYNNGQPFPLHFRQTVHNSAGARAKTIESLFALSVPDYFGYYSISGIIYTIRVHQLQGITALMAILL